MTTSRDPMLRRQWKRFKVRGGALVVLNRFGLLATVGRRYVKLGPILNISLGGIACQYIETNQRNKAFEYLAIATMKGHILIDEIPFEVVRDTRLAYLPDQRVIRCRAVRFSHLSSYQNYQLETFINTYGFDPMNDRRSGRDRRTFRDPRFSDPEFRAAHDRREMQERRRDWRNRSR